MKTIYIKFRHQNDVYAIYPDYDLSPNDFILPKVCSRCGENLYIPVEFPESAIIVQPLPDVIRPLPKENSNLIFHSEPEPIVLEFTPNNKLSFDEQQRLRRFHSVSYVDENYWSMLIGGISKNPIKHKCYNLEGDNLCL